MSIYEPDTKQLSLDLDLEATPDVPFISDWNASHPFAGEYLGPAEFYVPSVDEASRYTWLVLDTAFIDAVISLHKQFDGHAPSRDQIVPGPGSTSFIAAYALWLNKRNVSEVFYIPPLYYTFHYFMKLHGIKLRPVSIYQAFENGFSMELPSHRTHLILTDPIWYAGKAVPVDVIGQIHEWQISTKSEVFVDGSFQYLKWSGDRHEPTAVLADEHTFRLICPTKMLGIFGYRVSYIILPLTIAKDFRWLHESITGSCSIGDLKFAQRAMQVLNSPLSNRKFSDYLEESYRSLKANGLIESSISPDCGYFVFARLKKQPQQSIRIMDQSYFEQARYPGYLRINLMLAEHLRSILT